MENSMKITDVRITILSNSDSSRKATASITIDNAFAVHNISIIESNNNLFISMPSRKMQNGEYKDIAHPISSDARKALQEIILDEYKNVIKNNRKD
jgi:stage V sporulation protein G